MNTTLGHYKREMQQELDAILRFWMQHCVDAQKGGFIGRMDHCNHIYPDAPKGSVLNSRILWTFSAVARRSGSTEHLEMATRAFKYLKDHFLDVEHGGVFWSVTAEGATLDTKKQIYALSFAVYACSEFYRLTAWEDAREVAKSLFSNMEQYSYDPVHGGYMEALSRNWQPLEDLRLSSKDANEKKSMNTHLHVLEGYANLYRIWPNELLRQRLVALVRHFLDHIIHPETHHLILFFDEAWNPRSSAISFGHDIEAAWLVQEAAEMLGDANLLAEVQRRSVLVAQAAARGLDKDGGLWYEQDGNHLVKEKHWWPQAEAMVGFFNAWQLSGEEVYLHRSVGCWDFVKKYLLDQQLGEWVWGVREDYSLMEAEDKVGIWKCNYHNSRACLELIHRLEQVTK